MGGQDQTVRPRLDNEVAHRYRWKARAFELRPRLASVNRNVEPEFRAQEKNIILYQILLDDVSQEKPRRETLTEAF
jgi:hypothetical protein